MHFMMGWTHNVSPSLWLCDPTGLQHHVLPRKESWEKTHRVVCEEGSEESHHFWRALPILALISNSWGLQLKQAKKSPTYQPTFYSYPIHKHLLPIPSARTVGPASVQCVVGRRGQQKKITSTKVDYFGNKGLGNSYIWSCLADSCKQYGADKWG